MLDAAQELVRKCTTKAGVLHLTTEWSTSTPHVYREHPNYIEVGALSRYVRERLRIRSPG